MALSKKFLKTKAACKVRFTLDEKDVWGAQNVYLVGEFNDWAQDCHRMKKSKNGAFACELELPLGKDYQFRYYLDTGEWVNDPAADAYIRCGFSGVENSVVKV